MNHTSQGNNWDYENGMYEDDEDLDGIESLMNDQSDDDNDDDTNSRSENDAEESNSEDDERDEAELLEDEENYRRFVHSVFFDDDVRSTNSFNDEDDEEYRPDEVVDAEDDDEFDETSNRKLDKVRKNELQGLVNECWQTIVGEAPVLPVGAAEEEYSKEQSNDKVATDLTSPTKRRLQSPVKLRPQTTESSAVPLENNSNIIAASEGIVLQAPTSAASTTAVASTFDDLDSPNKPVRTNTSGVKTKAQTNSSGQSVISSLVSQMFTGEKPFEVCVEGMPVDAIRKLVARQMSMATQLLVQILLQGDEKSECFTTAYTSLMELSNLRDTALKKAKLIQINMNNVTAIHNFNRDKQRLKKLKFKDGHDDSSVASSMNGGKYEDEAVDNILALKAHRGSVGNDLSDDESVSVFAADGQNRQPVVIERRLTRSGISAITSAASTRSTSVFDIPALSKVHNLFLLIDQARQDMKQKASEAANNTTTTSSSSSSSGESVNETPNKEKTKSKVAATPDISDDMKSRIEKLAACNPHVAKIMNKSNMRMWNCLLPQRSYPLHESIVMKTDPTSLTGRSMFTPAEDDLLLRGIITLGENNWAKIRTTFLPSKEAQLLQFRFSQMTSLTATQDNNIFKRYQKLEVEYRNRDVKWSHEEDIDLLKGFQIFGERWPLIGIFFLPNRKRREIKHRWMQLQKIWQRGFQIHQLSRTGEPTELNDSMRSFLMEINYTPKAEPKSESAPNNNNNNSSSTAKSNKKMYQNSVQHAKNNKNHTNASVDMYLNQPSFNQYQYHGGPARQQYPYAPPGQYQQQPYHHPYQQQLFQQQHMVHTQTQQPPLAPIQPVVQPSQAAPDYDLMDFDMSSNSCAPLRIVDMTSASNNNNHNNNHSASNNQSYARNVHNNANNSYNSNIRAPIPNSVPLTTNAAAPLSLGPYLLNNDRVPPTTVYIPPYAPQIAPDPMRTIHRNAPLPISTSNTCSSSVAVNPQIPTNSDSTKINILKTKPKKTKQAPPVSASLPASDTLDGFTMSSIPEFRDVNIEIIPASAGIPVFPNASASSSKKLPKSKSVSIARKSPTKVATSKVDKATTKSTKPRKNKANSAIEAEGSSILLPPENTITGLLQLPFDANATDSAWGIAGLNKHYDATVVNNAFNDDHSVAHRSITQSSAPTTDFDDGLYSNLLQLGGLSNLMPLQSLQSPPRPTRSQAKSVTTPGSGLDSRKDFQLFSPPTGRMGQSTNIKRKLSTSKNLMSSLSDSYGGVSSGGIASIGVDDVSEVLSPSKKAKKGGLFASVMANVKK